MSMNVDELNALVGLQSEQIESLGDELAESQEKIKNLEGNLRVAMDNEEVLAAELAEVESWNRRLQSELQERREQSDRLRSQWIHMRRERDVLAAHVASGPPFIFDRYRFGMKMAEGVRIEGADTLEDATTKAATIAARKYPKGDVLALASTPPTSLARRDLLKHAEALENAAADGLQAATVDELVDMLSKRSTACRRQAEANVSDESIEKENDDMGEAPVVTGSKTVYVAWQNTDLTEGKGGLVPLAVCEAHATAVRLGMGKDVQGSNCSVTEEIAVKVKGHPRHWLAPSEIIRPSEADAKREKERLARAEARERKIAAVARAREAGLTDEDIKALEEDL